MLFLTTASPLRTTRSRPAMGPPQRALARLPAGAAGLLPPEVEAAGAGRCRNVSWGCGYPHVWAISARPNLFSNERRGVHAPSFFSRFSFLILRPHVAHRSAGGGHSFPSFCSVSISLLYICVLYFHSSFVQRLVTVERRYVSVFFLRPFFVRNQPLSFFRPIQ